MLLLFVCCGSQQEMLARKSEPRRFDKIIQQADLESQIKKNGQLVFRDQRAVKSRSGASASRNKPGRNLGYTRSSASTY
jgi:hypothetical protein